MADGGTPKPERRITGRRRRDGHKIEDWIAPDDMPDELFDLVSVGAACGAAIKGKPGCYCSMKPVANQSALGRPLPHRCKHHGGATPIAGRTKKNTGENAKNYKHGIYVNSLLPGEEDAYIHLLEEGQTTLQHEIAMTKLRLRRAIEAEAEQEMMLEQGGFEETLELTKRERSDKQGFMGHEEKTKEVKSRRNYGAIIDKIVGQLAKLVRSQDMLGIASGELTPEEYAERMRNALRGRKGIEPKGTNAEPTPT